MILLGTKMTRLTGLPPHPIRIGVVTSPDGAAFRDIISVMRRRWPVGEIYLAPTRVQGDGAEQEIVRALTLADRIPGVEVIIVGRGGGSREDLWCFNTELVARAVAHLRTPVVSAVGHETDVCLTDLVADLRAPTPSAAAEATVPDAATATVAVDELAQRLGRSLSGRTQLGRERVERTADRLVASIQDQLRNRQSEILAHAARLDALSPLKVLQRGYAVPRGMDGTVLRSIRDFPSGLDFRLTVADGDVAAVATGDGTTP